MRLSVEAKVTPSTIGKITLESGGDNTDLDTWGCTTCDAKGTYGFGNGKAGGVTILEAWIQHSGSGLLGVPALVKVGHMPIKVGNGLWLDHSKFGDDAILFGVDPMKNIHFILGTVKFTERSTTENDDGNAYVLLFNYEFENLPLPRLTSRHSRRAAGARPEVRRAGARFAILQSRIRRGREWHRNGATNRSRAMTCTVCPPRAAP